jgi:hypothetical protein
LRVQPAWELGPCGRAKQERQRRWDGFLPLPLRASERATSSSTFSTRTYYYLAQQTPALAAEAAHFPFERFADYQCLPHHSLTPYPVRPPFPLNHSQSEAAARRTRMNDNNNNTINQASQSARQPRQGKARQTIRERKRSTTTTLPALFDLVEGRQAVLEANNNRYHHWGRQTQTSTSSTPSINQSINQPTSDSLEEAVEGGGGGSFMFKEEEEEGRRNCLFYSFSPSPSIQLVARSQLYYV